MALRATAAIAHMLAVWLAVSCSELNNVPSEVGTVAPTDGREIDAIQLAGCNTDCGRVEIKVDGESSWGMVCSPDHWTLTEAQVICRSLGFDSAFGAMPTFGGGECSKIATRVAHESCGTDTMFAVILLINGGVFDSLNRPRL